MRRCIIVSSLFRTFPESRRQVLNLNAGKAYLVESVFFATSGLWESNPIFPRPPLKKDFRKELRVTPLHLAKGNTLIQLRARKRLA